LNISKEILDSISIKGHQSDNFFNAVWNCPRVKIEELEKYIKIQFPDNLLANELMEQVIRVKKDSKSWQTEERKIMEEFKSSLQKM